MSGDCYIGWRFIDSFQQVWVRAHTSFTSYLVLAVHQAPASPLGGKMGEGSIKYPMALSSRSSQSGRDRLLCSSINVNVHRSVSRGTSTLYCMCNRGLPPELVGRGAVRSASLRKWDKLQGTWRSGWGKAKLFRAERKFESMVGSRKERRLVWWDRERGLEAGQASPRGLGSPCGFWPDPSRCLGAAAATVASSREACPILLMWGALWDAELELLLQSAFPQNPSGQQLHWTARRARLWCRTLLGPPRGPVHGVSSGLLRHPYSSEMRWVSTALGLSDPPSGLCRRTRGQLGRPGEEPRCTDQLWFFITAWCFWLAMGTAHLIPHLSPRSLSGVHVF